MQTVGQALKTKQDKVKVVFFFQKCKIQMTRTLKMMHKLLKNNKT